MLKFSPGKHNAKLKKLEKKLGLKVYTFSLMSGHTCPYAKDCHSKAIETPEGWRIEDGPHTQFRCFSASQDVLFTALRKQRQHNMQVVELASKPLGVVAAAALIESSIPLDAEVIRIHVGGDFKTQAYFDAWLNTAKAYSHILFYAYTKSLPFWVKRLNDIPKNFHLTASYGGHRDDLIAKYNLRYAKVVYTQAEAKRLGLDIDHDDSHAAGSGPSFALLIHGAQPKGSEANKALQRIKRRARRKVVA